MDVILARLDPRQLRVHCSDALRQELAKTFELLQQALSASKRAEEVQRASHKLAVQEFQDDSALLHKLEQIDSVRLQLSISIDQIVRGAKGKPTRADSPSPHLVKSEGGTEVGMQSIMELSSSSVSTAVDTNMDDSMGHMDVIDLSAVDTERVPAASPAASRKRKLSISSTTEHLQPPSSASAPSVTKKFVPVFKHIASHSRLGKAMQAALDCSVDVMKRKVGDRIQGFGVLASKIAVVSKVLESAEYTEVQEAMDALNHLIAVAVSVLVKAKPHAKRQVAIKALKSIQDAQIKFPGFATLFDKSYASLSKYIDATFPLSAKETEELKRRVRTTLKEVKAWESGTYSVPDFQDKMRVLKQALDSNCEGYNAKKDAAVLELLDMLVARLSGFKDSQAQDKRKETLQVWRAEMKVSKPTKSQKKKKAKVAAADSDKPSPLAAQASNGQSTLGAAAAAAATAPSKQGAKAAKSAAPDAVAANSGTAKPNASKASKAKAGGEQDAAGKASTSAAKPAQAKHMQSVDNQPKKQPSKQS